MKIAIGCSVKYRDTIHQVCTALEKLGHTPLFPNLNPTAGNIDVAHTTQEKKQLALEHYQAIDESDVVYFVTPKGHMGTSCTLELGYAIAKKKLIYFSEPTGDIAKDCYASAFIPTDNLEQLLKHNQ